VANNIKDILIAGVGGQGTLLASKLLGAAFIAAGDDVKVSEVHGMSQRGGSVVTYVRRGQNISSPLIDKGEADMIMAFESLEAGRWLPYLKKGGVIIANTGVMMPMSVIMGNAEYPYNVLDLIEQKGVNVIRVDADRLALEAGSPKCVNVVLLGAAARYLGFDSDVWLDIIANTVPQKTVGINQKAFMLGYKTEE